MIATAPDTTLYEQAHADLLHVIEQAKREYEQAEEAMNNATGPDYVKTLIAYARASVRHSTLIEAGLIFSLGIPQED